MAAVGECAATIVEGDRARFTFLVDHCVQIAIALDVNQLDVRACSAVHHQDSRLCWKTAVPDVREQQHRPGTVAKELADNGVHVTVSVGVAKTDRCVAGRWSPLTYYIEVAGAIVVKQLKRDPLLVVVMIDHEQIHVAVMVNISQVKVMAPANWRF